MPNIESPIFCLFSRTAASRSSRVRVICGRAAIVLAREVAGVGRAIALLEVLVIEVIAEVAADAVAMAEAGDSERFLLL